MEFSILVEGSDIQLDERVDCRRIINGFIYLGEFINDSNPESIEKEPIRLGIRAYYYLNIGCLVMLRSIQEDKLLDHRSNIIAWRGGLVAHMEVDAFLAQSLHWAAARLRNLESFRDGKFAKNYRFEPAASLASIFNPPEPQPPTPMGAAPITVEV
jgi:hypothetical protein